MVTCSECGCNFDNGELIGGVCRECAEIEQKKMTRAYNVCRILNSPWHQMELELEGAG